MCNTLAYNHFVAGRILGATAIFQGKVALVNEPGGKVRRRKQMSGMIQLDQKLVDSLIKEHLSAAVISTLSEKKDVLLRSLADTVLNLKVNADGRVSNYSSENKFSWIEITLNKELRGVILASVKEQLEAIKPDIEKAIKKEVAKSGSAIAKAIMGGFTEALKVDYKFNITLSPGRE